MKISATVLCFNEEDHIGELLETIDWVDEIVIVDSGSTDRTLEIARQFTSNIHHREFTSFKEQHEYADSLTMGDWILWMDSDERVTPVLRASIERVKTLAESQLPDGFRFKRRTWFLGRWIWHSGWYPDPQMRLYRKSASHWAGRPPHETARVEGRVEDLEGEILHFTKRHLSHYHRAIDSFTSQAAAAIDADGAHRGAFGIFLSALVSFLRAFVLKQGFRDGIRGFFISAFTAYGVFLKYAKAWEINAKPERRPSPEQTATKSDDVSS